MALELRASGVAEAHSFGRGEEKSYRRNRAYRLRTKKQRGVGDFQ